MDMFTPNEEEKSDGMITKNACSCGICRSSADRYQNMFICQKDPSHIADLFTGIFSDLSFKP